MALRSDSTFNAWIDERKFLSGEQVKAAEIDKVYDDQDFVLDCKWMLVSDVFVPISNTDTSYSGEVYYNIPGKHLCGVDDLSVCPTSVAFYTWVSAGAGDVQLNVASGNTVSTAVTNTVPEWITVGSVLNIDIAMANQEMHVQSKKTTSGTIYLAGVLVYANAT